MDDRIQMSFDYIIPYSIDLFVCIDCVYLGGVVWVGSDFSIHIIDRRSHQGAYAKSILSFSLRPIDLKIG
jgi:hypothetical protein